MILLKNITTFVKVVNFLKTLPCGDTIFYCPNVRFMNATNIVITDITQLLHLSLGNKWKDKLKDAGISSHAITKHISENPEESTNKTLCKLARLLKMHPYELIVKYRIGVDRLDEDEVGIWRDYYDKDIAA